jgi:asparagine synthetase B (glutamine-hydrolysing)
MSRPADQNAHALELWHEDWIARVTLPADGAALALTVTGVEGSRLSIADSPDAHVIFSGLLTNAVELDVSRRDSPAQCVLQLYERHGPDFCLRLRGPFAVVVWNRRTSTVIVARDHVGMQPLFLTRRDTEWLLSGSADRLAREPAVSRAIDAVALSEWLCGWYPVPEATAYRDIERVAPATRLTIRASGVEMERYWTLSAEDRPVDWLTEDDLDQFDDLLARAVRRSLTAAGPEPPAIFLSGGLDSIAIALTASDELTRCGLGKPLALSLGFTEGDTNEQTIQRGVADRLGLEQELVPFDEAAGPTGLLDAALAMTADWPQPMWNMWAPAYAELARRGRARGARLILTGRGGDEWLTASPYLLADLVGRGQLFAAWRQLQTIRRSNDIGGAGATMGMLSRVALRPLASAALDWLAPTAWHADRRRRLLAERPAWIAPEPAVRTEMDARVEQWIAPARPKAGFYMREARVALAHPALTHDMEETQEFGRRTNQFVLHPYWDVDLVSLLYRMPPDLLVKDGRSKWLLRRRVANRLPGLGLEQRVKVNAHQVFTGIVWREIERAWNQLGGLHALAQAGVVSSAGLQLELSTQPGLRAVGSPGRAWSLLNLETWVRRRI